MDFEKFFKSLSRCTRGTSTRTKYILYQLTTSFHFMRKDSNSQCSYLIDGMAHQSDVVMNVFTILFSWEPN